MHFVVSWDIEASGETWKTLNTKMKKGLGSYSWVRPLSTFYIVKVSGQYDWDSINDALVAVAKQHPKKINFIMTPLMQGGTYDGYLPGGLWDKVRKRTK